MSTFIISVFVKNTAKNTHKQKNKKKQHTKYIVLHKESKKPPSRTSKHVCQMLSELPYIDGLWKSLVTPCVDWNAPKKKNLHQLSNNISVAFLFLAYILYSSLLFIIFAHLHRFIFLNFHTKKEYKKLVSTLGISIKNFCTVK